MFPVSDGIDSISEEKWQREVAYPIAAKLFYISRLVRVILAQGPCIVLCIIPIITDESRRESAKRSGIVVVYAWLHKQLLLRIGSILKVCRF